VAMNIETFRTDFPEFADDLKWSDSVIKFWSDFGERMVLEKRWCSEKPIGVQLFTAHHIVLAKSNEQSSTNGALPGQINGPAASKTVGSASISYDTNSSLEEGAGHWNLTTYGKQFIHLARMFGAGAYQI
jgi:hypothetical protein